MAATVELRSYHGVPPAGTDVRDGALRFKNADNDVLDNNNPVVKPGRSYIKQLRFYAVTAPSNNLTNIRFYMSGTGFGAGVQLELKTEFSYTDPVVLGTDDMGGGVDAFTYTALAPLVPALVSGGLATPNTGAFGPYFKFQLDLGASASLGTLPTQSGMWTYDEF